MTGYSPALAALAQKHLSTLAGLYRVAYPYRDLPVRAKTGELHRDLLIAALLPPLKRPRVTRPYPREASCP